MSGRSGCRRVPPLDFPGCAAGGYRCGGLAEASRHRPAVGRTALGLPVIAIPAGAPIPSRVNDSGFWVVNRYFGLDVTDTFRSRVVMESLIALMGFAGLLILSLVIP